MHLGAREGAGETVKKCQKHAIALYFAYCWVEWKASLVEDEHEVDCQSGLVYKTAGRTERHVF